MREICVNVQDAELVYVVINLVYTILWWPCYLLFIIGVLIVYPVLGAILLATKLVSFPHVKKWWEKTFNVRERNWLVTESAAVKRGEGAKAQLRVYNLSVLVETLVESVPQIAIQVCSTLIRTVHPACTFLLRA